MNERMKAGVMPTLVAQTIKARQLRVGDVIEDDGITYLTVTQVDIKTRYVHVHVRAADGQYLESTCRYEIDHDIVVRRPTATRVEFIDAVHQAAAYWARHEIAASPGEVEKTRNQLVEDLAYRPESHSYAYARYVKAQAVAAIWTRVAKLAEQDGVSLVDALYEMRDTLTDDFVGASFENRSTSHLANAIEAVDREAKSDWLQQLKMRLPTRVGGRI